MEKLHNIKGVFLDLGGTLIYPPSGHWNFSHLAYRFFPKEKLAEPRAVAAREAAMAEMDKRHLLHSMDEEYEQFYGYYKAVADALPELGLSADDLRTVTEDKLHNKRDNYRAFDDTVRTLEALRGTYKLGIISDTWPSIVPALEHLGILKYFDCVTYSYQLGTLKPDPRMYQDALAKMGLPVEQTVFVDDLAKNLIGAQEQGIHPVLIRALNQIEAWPGTVEPCEGMPYIDRISGLLELLD